MADPFKEIARDYDRMFLRDLDADRNMLVGLLERFGAKTVLDCACGTGVHTEMLAREGYEVVGSDASASMLEVARSKLDSAGLAVDLYVSAWRDLPSVVRGTYDAVICMGNSLSLESDCEAVAQSLSSMYSIVSDGGFLLVSNTNVDRQLAEMVGIEVVEPEADCLLMLVKVFREEITTHRYFFIDTTGAEPSMRHYRFELLNLTMEKVEECARRAGIHRYTLYGEKDLTPYDRRESERLIFVAEKAGS